MAKLAKDNLSFKGWIFMDCISKSGGLMLLSMGDITMDLLLFFFRNGILM